MTLSIKNTRYHLPSIKNTRFPLSSSSVLPPPRSHPVDLWETSCHSECLPGSSQHTPGGEGTWSQSSTLPTGTILSSRMPAAPPIPAAGNPHLRRPPGHCQATVLFTVKQRHSWPAARRWVSVLRSSYCEGPGCQQPSVWGTVHADLWEGGGEKEGCVLLPRCPQTPASATS